MLAVLEGMEINVFLCHLLIIIVRQPWSQLCKNTPKPGFIDGFGRRGCVESESHDKSHYTPRAILDAILSK